MGTEGKKYEGLNSRGLVEGLHCWLSKPELLY